MIKEMKGIIHIRIDDRMIHGQVATQWTNQLNASRIMVINDEVANDITRKSIVRLAAPPNVHTSIITKEKALNNILNGKYEGQRVLVVAVSPIDIKYLLDNGLPIKTVNVGNLSRRSGTKRIRPTININEQERQAFQDLIDAGVEVTVIQTPKDSLEYMKDFL
ncbi:PTS mannose/fructose/sorbose transporter subunit IIB [Bombilactobacillus bombi]|uniref:PTS system mannose/fructose/N-acetylgalactosamine-transporter subunit IIB n=1 Tax=Bombilactobacillus bombi TaxID=1303590 RepID=UPI000E580AF8|nr:PTS sugar transporter subunit IIB [Bombilactobacillus bombi]AXX65082.1 PTS mannose/fructose/sorbose transporter subunit IIB [Bombilactobacillus bombi]